MIVILYLIIINLIIEEAKLLAKQVSQVLSKGCYILRKLFSNDPRVIEDMIDPERSPSLIDFSNDGQIKTLGLKWLDNSDHLIYSVSVSDNNVITKRQILSDISRIFDP